MAFVDILIDGHSPVQFMVSSCSTFLLLWRERSLTAELHSDEVLEALVLQKHSRGRAGLEVKGNIRGQLRLQGGEVQVRRLLVEGGRVPYRLWKETEERKKREWKHVSSEFWDSAIPFSPLNEFQQQHITSR